MVDAALAIESGEASGLVEAANIAASPSTENSVKGTQPTYRTREEYVASLRASGHVTEEERLAQYRAPDWTPNIGVWDDPTVGQP